MVAKKSPTQQDVRLAYIHIYKICEHHYDWLTTQE